MQQSVSAVNDIERFLWVNGFRDVCDLENDLHDITIVIEANFIIVEGNYTFFLTDSSCRACFSRAIVIILVERSTPLVSTPYSRAMWKAEPPIPQPTSRMTCPGCKSSFLQNSCQKKTKDYTIACRRISPNLQLWSLGHRC